MSSPTVIPSGPRVALASDLKPSDTSAPSTDVSTPLGHEPGLDQPRPSAVPPTKSSPPKSRHSSPQTSSSRTPTFSEKNISPSGTPPKQFRPLSAGIESTVQPLEPASSTNPQAEDRTYASLTPAKNVDEPRRDDEAAHTTVGVDPPPSTITQPTSSETPHRSKSPHANDSSKETPELTPPVTKPIPGGNMSAEVPAVSLGLPDEGKDTPFASSMPSKGRAGSPTPESSKTVSPKPVLPGTSNFVPSSLETAASSDSSAAKNQSIGDDGSSTSYPCHDTPTESSLLPSNLPEQSQPQGDAVTLVADGRPDPSSDESKTQPPFHAPSPSSLPPPDNTVAYDPPNQTVSKDEEDLGSQADDTSKNSQSEEDGASGRTKSGRASPTLSGVSGPSDEIAKNDQTIPLALSEPDHPDAQSKGTGMSDPSSPKAHASPPTSVNLIPQSPPLPQFHAVRSPLPDSPSPDSPKASSNQQHQQPIKLASLPLHHSSHDHVERQGNVLDGSEVAHPETIESVRSASTSDDNRSDATEDLGGGGDDDDAGACSLEATAATSLENDGPQSSVPSSKSDQNELLEEGESEARLVILFQQYMQASADSCE